MQHAVGAGALQDFGNKGVGEAGGIVGNLLVGDAEADIGNHTEETAFLPLDGDVAADGHVFYQNAAVQLDLDAFIERTGNDNTEFLGLRRIC